MTDAFRPPGFRQVLTVRRLKGANDIARTKASESVVPTLFRNGQAGMDRKTHRSAGNNLSLIPFNVGQFFSVGREIRADLVPHSDPSISVGWMLISSRPSASMPPNVASTATAASTMPMIRLITLAPVLPMIR